MSARAAFVALALLAAPEPDAPNIIGVVEVPRLLKAYTADGEPLKPEGIRIPLRARPTSDAPVVATIVRAEELATVEYTYEELGAMVHGRDGDWSLVKTSGGIAGWMAAADAGEFHSLDMLLRDRLTYLTDAWDGVLTRAPASTERVNVPADPERRLAGYLEPNLQTLRIVLQPGDDEEEIRQRYRPTGMGSSRGPDGTRVLSLETGIMLPAFEQPSTLTPIVTHFETNRADAAFQNTHQSPPQVVVFDSRPGWFQVGLANADNWRGAKRAWLQASPVWRFRAVASEAESSRLATRAFGPESRDVRVLGLRTVSDALWAEVEIVNQSECASIEPPKVRARGWIPVHAPSGALNVWYYARGC